jgi:hypothetical protein
MSTIKTDTIVAVSTNGDLSLDGLGTGGVSIASTLKMAKGGDIASASPLVIDTDGNYFDVTGTTNFSVMTVESGNFFMLQFDSALTITHGSGIELPGAANLTTATGDRLMCYATAANTVEVMSVETEAAASSGIVLQTISMTIAETTTTSQIPNDDTAPTSSEGAEIGTQAITMADNSNKVLILASINITISAVDQGMVLALFRGTTCIAVRVRKTSSAGNRDGVISFSHLDSPTTSGSVTYSIRAGREPSSGTIYIGSLEGTGADFGDLLDDGAVLMEISA